MTSHNSELQTAHETVDHAGPRGASPESVAAGHETADVNPRGLVIAGIILFGTCFVTAGLMYGLWMFLRPPAPPPGPVPDPFAVERNRQDVNQRLAEVPSPRLEGAREFEKPQEAVTITSHPNADKQSAITDPSKGEAPNPPQFHAEDLRPERVPGLRDFAWADKDKKVAVIPVEEAMKIARKANRFPVQNLTDEQKKAVEQQRTHIGDAERAKSSNSGRPVEEKK
jgi:hypothetical protein